MSSLSTEVILLLLLHRKPPGLNQYPKEDGEDPAEADHDACVDDRALSISDLAHGPALPVPQSRDVDLVWGK